MEQGEITKTKLCRLIQFLQKEMVDGQVLLERIFTLQKKLLKRQDRREVCLLLMNHAGQLDVAFVLRYTISDLSALLSTDEKRFLFKRAIDSELQVQFCCFVKFKI